jgi:zinc protease
VPKEPEQMEERRLVIRDKVAGHRFAHAYHITAADNDDSYALDVLANILFEGTGSRAYRRMVDQKELVLGIDGSAYTPTYPGLFIMSSTVKDGVPVEKAEAELWDIIREVQRNGVTAEEIQAAVRQLTVEMVRGVRTPHGMGTLIGTATVTLGDTARFTQDLAKYFKVTASDVLRVANQYLHPNNRSVVILSPENAQ